jgi:hypothetical protein
MMHLARVVALSIGLLSVVSGSPSAVARASSELPMPATWTPAAASLVVYVDWQTLLSSPPLRGLERLLTEQEPSKELENLRELTGMDPWQDAWAFSFFTISEEDDSSRWGLAIYGAFDPERILEALQSQRHLRRVTHREMAIYLLDSADGSKALAFPDSTTVLIGPLDQLREMLDTGLGFAPSAADGELGDALERLSMGETLWAVGKDANKLPVVLRGRATSPETGVALRSFVVSAKFGSDVDFEAQGEASSREEAQRLADLVKGLRAFATFQRSAEPGFLEVLDTLEVQTLDESVEISAEIDGDLLRDLLKRSVKKRKKKIATSR